MKDKICPFCNKRAKIKPLLDPYKKTNTKTRLRLYDFACGTEGCYLEFGAGFHYEKGNIEILDHMWKNIPDYVAPVKAVKKVVKKVVKQRKRAVKFKPVMIHFSMSESRDGICCSSRAKAKEWTDNASKVSCPRCAKTQNVQYLLNQKEVS